MRFPASIAAAGLLLAGCGADGGGETAAPSPSPSPVLVAGTYSGTSSTERRQFQGETPDPSQAVPTPVQFYLTCADDACTTVHQRTDQSEDSFLGGTYRFAVKGATWVAVDERRGTCQAPATGPFVQRITFTWTRAQDGSMQAVVDQTFTGCKRDGSARHRATVGAGRLSDVPYVAPAESGLLKRALNAYDTAQKGVYAQYPVCDKQFYGSQDAAVVKGADCFERLLGTVASANAALDTAVDAKPVAAPRGACASALTLVGNAERAAEAARKAEAAFKAAATDFRPAGAALEEYTEVDGELRAAVVRSAYACIAPDDVEALGTDGELAIDIDGLLLPQDA